MLTKNVNGKEVHCTPEEESQIRLEWSENEKLIHQEFDKWTRKTYLEKKYGDPHEAIDKICNKLGIDFEKL